MKEKKIKKKYLLKIKEITKHNQLYFNKSKPIISDKDYDKLKQEIVELEKNFTFLKSGTSPSKIIGFKPSKNFVKAKHRTKMLSLSNTFNKDDLESHKIEELIDSPIDENIKEIIQDIDKEKIKGINNEYDSSSEEEIIVSKIKHYNKEYYTDSDLKPTEQLFFSLTIVPLGSYETKNILPK